MNLADTEDFDKVYADFKPTKVLHMAAQAGVRYSIETPQVYVDSNLKAFLNVLESCRKHGTEHFVYASSSSVYGANTLMPYSVHSPTEHPISLYAATKKANELMAHSYSLVQDARDRIKVLYRLRSMGATRYGGIFVHEKILSVSQSTFLTMVTTARLHLIDDIVEGVLRVLAHPPTPNLVWSGNSPDPATAKAPYRIYNIGNHQSVLLSDFIATLERVIGKKAKLEMKPMQPGDVPTHSPTWTTSNAILVFRQTLRSRLDFRSFGVVSVLLQSLIRLHSTPNRALERLFRL